MAKREMVRWWTAATTQLGMADGMVMSTMGARVSKASGSPLKAGPSAPPQRLAKPATRQNAGKIAAVRASAAGAERLPGGFLRDPFPRRCPLPGGGGCGHTLRSTRGTAPESLLGRAWGRQDILRHVRPGRFVVIAGTRDF